MDARSERRVRVVWVGEFLMCDILQVAHDWTPECFFLPRLTCLPEGTRIERIAYDEMRRAFGVLISHRTFDQVEIGARPPEIPLEEVKVEFVKFTRGKPQ